MCSHMCIIFSHCMHIMFSLEAHRMDRNGGSHFPVGCFGGALSTRPPVAETGRQATSLIRAGGIISYVSWVLRLGPKVRKLHKYLAFCTMGWGGVCKLNGSLCAMSARSCPASPRTRVVCHRGLGSKWKPQPQGGRNKTFRERLVVESLCDLVAVRLSRRATIQCMQQRNS